MAKDQLKGAAGIEFITEDISGYDTNDDTSFKVGLVGWTPKGPSNKVVSVSDSNTLYSYFGTPTKNAKNNQLLYAAKMLLDTGATLRIVRQVDVDENLDAVSINVPVHNVLDYDTILDGITSGTTSGTNYSYVAGYTGYTAISNKISDVVDLLEDNISISENPDPQSLLTLATKYPGFSGYYVSVQTYSYYGDSKETTAYGTAREANIDTLTSKKITDDVTFTAYVLNEGLYDPTVDRYDPNYTFTYTNDDDIEIHAQGAFLRYNQDSGAFDTLNQELSEFINIFGLLRVYSSSTSTNALLTIPFTRINYVNTAGTQLYLNEISNNIISGKINTAYAGDWKNITPYTLSVNNGVVTSKITKVLLKGSESNLTTPVASPDYTYGWELFKDISSVKVNLLCAAGTTVKDFGNKLEDLELINQAVIVSMLDVCTIRKDCIAIFDLPKRKDIDKLIQDVELYVPGVGAESGGSNASYETYWGAMYDGRQVMFDKFNKKDVEVAMTSFVACNITNVWTTQYPWYIVAGTSRGSISYPSNGNVYIRYYPVAVGALTKERINTTRNLDGQFIWGECTLQRKATSLNRLHASSLLAYLYGRLRTKFTPYVFDLNTPDLRKTVREEAIEVLSYIKAHSGLNDYYVTCDDTNNTSTTIDNNQLIVNIGLEITKGAEVIEVYNTLYRTNGIIEAGLSSK
jgi:hypothetical protein